MPSWEAHQGDLYPRSIKMAFSQSIHGEGQEKKFFFFSPTQLPEDEISNVVSLSQRDIIIWF